jgi:Fic family protein
MPILFERPTYEWVARVNQKHKQLAELSLSEEAKQAFDRWLETEFVYSTLRLEGEEIEREQVVRLVSAPASSPDAGGPGAATRLLDSLRTVTALARERGNDSVLSVELLRKLNDLQGGQGLSSTESTSKVKAEIPPVVLEGACQWFSADSFRELHPIEQAGIVLLRLIDLRPFNYGNDQTALVAASLFTLRSGLPPIIICVRTQPAYRAALNEGVRMNTKPMVELIAESIEQSLSKMILQSK